MGRSDFANFGTRVVANLAAHFGMGHFGVSCWADIFTEERAGSGQLSERTTPWRSGTFPNADLELANFWATTLDQWEQLGIAAENMRGNFRTEFGLNREANLGALRRIGEASAGVPMERWNGSDSFGFRVCNSFCFRYLRATSPRDVPSGCEVASRLPGGFCDGAEEQLFFCAHSFRLASTTARSAGVRICACLRSSSV